MSTATTRRRLLAALAVALVLAGCVVGYLVVRSVPDHRTTLLVDTSAPGTDFPAVADAVEATAHNTGDADALSLRRFGGECGAADNTSEVTDEADEVPGVVRALTPTGRATLLSGVLAAIDDFSRIYPFRGSQRNRIVVVSTTGVDACTQEQAEVSRAIRERVDAAGLALDIRVIGHRVPAEQRESLERLASEQAVQAVAFTEDAAELTEVLDKLVVPESPEAARINVTTTAPPQPLAYAYVTAERFAVVRDERAISEVAGDFGDFGVIPDPHFTLDGRFAYAVSPAGIAVVDVADGEDRTVPCGECWNAVVVGGSRIAWLERDANRIITLDLGTPGAQPTPAPVVIPAPRAIEPYTGPSEGAIMLLAGASDAVLVGVVPPPVAYGGSVSLYLLDFDGTVRDFGIADGGHRIGQTGTISPDGRTAVYLTIRHMSICHRILSLVPVDVETGERRPSLTPGVLGDPTDVDGSLVQDVRYDREGRLNATFSTLRCGPRFERIPVQPPTRMRLEGDRWVALEDAPVQTHPLGDDTSLVFVDPPLGVRGGTLFLETAGRRIPVADGVIAIGVAPDR
ncbi:hypothetical protein [Saccharothrix sp. NRRL B-16348]|uniref:hypothetical protein n=1 Tax=Saccharothrix sp. NRRL B-16348 TaxID=1415542 RepID=UPI0006B04881|nr:hypothetical protein [Saccharothrix sp. NRRL B-16348]